MISVTVVASRSGKILLVIQRFGVNARLVLVELIVRDAVALHVVGVSVTRAAGLSHVESVDF